MIKSLELVLILESVCELGKCESITIEDICNFSQTHIKKIGCSDSGSVSITESTKDDIDSALKILMNGGFIFKSDGYFYPTIRGLSLVTALQPCDDFYIDFYDLPFSLIEKQALSKSENNYLEDL